MSNTAQDTLVLFEEFDSAIREALSTLDASAHGLTREPAGTQLPNLQSAVYGIDAPVVHRLTPFEQHRKKWTSFVSGENGVLDKHSVKYLCWVPEVAVDERFLNHVENSSIELRWRSLAGLVRSCHCRWDDLSTKSPSLSRIRTLLKRCKGTNPAMLRWQANPDALLSQKGPLLLAELLIRTGKGLKPFLDEWLIETQSPFFQKVIQIAAATCRQQINRLPDDVMLMLFRDILSWKGWNPPAFKKEVGALILHQPMNSRIQEIVQRFVLHHSGLGDPRIRVNGLKWAEVTLQARKVFIDWLQRENSFTFSEHIFKQGKGWIWQNTASRLEPLAFGRPEWR